MSKDQNSHAKSGAPPGAAPGAPARRGASSGDGFLSSLSDLESRINALKASHAQAETREVEFGAREAAIATREADVADPRVLRFETYEVQKWKPI